MSFSEFYQRSINEPEQFWAEQARRIDWQTPFTQTLDHSNPPFARWFCEGRTNLCHNAIDRWLEKQPEALALIAVSSETEEERTFTFRQLHDEVNAVASMLRSLGGIDRQTRKMLGEMMASLFRVWSALLSQQLALARPAATAFPVKKEK